jgi:geranylgeranyl diphosphate synthase, type I
VTLGGPVIVEPGEGVVATVSGSGARAFESFGELWAEVRSRVDFELGELWKAELASAEHPELRLTLEAARDLCLRGGKRLRAALVALGYWGSSERGDWQPVLRACVAIELLQAYFLIHDDWMDRDDVRRGGPAVHAALGRAFHSEHQGACGAVLAGDYCAALSLACLSQVPLAADRVARAMAAYAELQGHAVLGQKLDLLSQNAPPEEIYRLKTGSYTVFGPLWLGAVLAGSSTDAAPRWRAFAEPVGIAFQLQDDLIGAFATTAESGKPWGSDLRAGKRTALVAAALDRGSAADVQALRQVLGNDQASDANLVQAARALVSSGARAAVEARIEELLGQAERSLQDLPVRRPDVFTLLRQATQALTHRKA